MRNPASETSIAARQSIVATANAVLNGSISLIEGALVISAAIDALGFALADDDYKTFVGIVSETDHLPLGKVREHWSPKALDDHQPEIDRLENWARRLGVPACENLVRRLAGERL